MPAFTWCCVRGKVKSSWSSHVPCQLSSLVLFELIAGELSHSFWKWVFQSPISEDINEYFGDLESQVTLHSSPIFPPLSSFFTEHSLWPDWQVQTESHHQTSTISCQSPSHLKTCYSPPRVNQEQEH